MKFFSAIKNNRIDINRLLRALGSFCCVKPVATKIEPEAGHGINGISTQAKSGHTSHKTFFVCFDNGTLMQCDDIIVAAKYDGRLLLNPNDHASSHYINRYVTAWTGFGPVERSQGLANGQFVSITGCW